MAWIESHQELANHPKTLRLARALRCGIPEAIGYLHLLWWWALSYSNEGRIEASLRQDASRFCHRVGKAERFWKALIEAGFVDQMADGSLLIHDWREYAGRLIERRQKNAERMRVVRSTSGARAKHVQRYQPDQPTNHVVVGVNKAPGPRAPDPGPGGPVGAAPDPNGVVDLGNGAQSCPICREVFQGTYLEHTAERHKVRSEPEDFRGKRTLHANQPLEDNGPLVPTHELMAEHERLLSRERANLS